MDTAMADSKEDIQVPSITISQAIEPHPQDTHAAIDRLFTNLRPEEYFSLLPQLRKLLLDEFESWSHYMKRARQTHYSQIISKASADSDSNDIKAKALIYVLETLPARHAKLASIDGDDALPLSATNAALLAQLKDSPGDMVWAGTHQNLLEDRAMIDGIVEQEEELAMLEELQMNRLRKLRECFLSGTFKDFKEPEDVVAFVQAMEAVGISVGNLTVKKEAKGMDRKTAQEVVGVSVKDSAIKEDANGGSCKMAQAVVGMSDGNSSIKEEAHGKDCQGRC